MLATFLSSVKQGGIIDDAGREETVTEEQTAPKVEKKMFFRWFLSGES